MLNFQELYETYVGEVYRFAFWLAGNRFDAEDITSETFICAWVHSSAIRTETLKAYLFIIARNIYLQQQRKRKYQVLFNDENTNPTPGPDKVVESKLKLERVQRFLQTLPEIERTAFVLRVYNEIPYAEIARVLELSLTATKVKVHRVRKKLIENFKDKEGY